MITALIYICVGFGIGSFVTTILFVVLNVITDNQDNKHREARDFASANNMSIEQAMYFV